MKEGAFDYLTKPLDWKMVRIAISRALEVRRLMTSAEQMRIARDQSRAFARRLAEAQEQERQRIARELHDGVGQYLIALNMNLNSLHDPLTDRGTGRTDPRLTDSIGIVSDMTESIRTIIYDIRPAVLDDFGLLAGIKSLTDKFSKHTNMDISVQGDDDMPRLPELVEITLYRIMQEALTNVAKHAQAKNISIRLMQSYESVLLDITDDGIGFDPALCDDPRSMGAWGMLNMRERADAIGGTFRIESEKGKGTRVVVEIRQ
jgi:signal transduction histidine kinase